jgi:oxalate decarboxylase/phosphoglucose isomerase-like protein (cupin superfamily)
MTVKAELIDPAAVPTQTLDWGAIKWFVTPAGTEGAKLSFGEVVVMPGGGHDRHNHPESEEILYILSGEGEQMLEDGDPFPIKPGDTLYIPVGVYHATRNTGWAPLRLLAIYNPGGPEQALATLPDFRLLPVGELPAWERR